MEARSHSTGSTREKGGSRMLIHTHFLKSLSISRTTCQNHMLLSDDDISKKNLIYMDISCFCSQEGWLASLFCCFFLPLLHHHNHHGSVQTGLILSEVQPPPLSKDHSKEPKRGGYYKNEKEETALNVSITISCSNSSVLKKVALSLYTLFSKKRFKQSCYYNHCHHRRHFVTLGKSQNVSEKIGGINKEK